MTLSLTKAQEQGAKAITLSLRIAYLMRPYNFNRFTATVILALCVCGGWCRYKDLGRVVNLRSLSRTRHVVYYLISVGFVERRITGRIPELKLTAKGLEACKLVGEDFAELAKMYQREEARKGE
jgi:hypothetical protein